MSQTIAKNITDRLQGHINKGSGTIEAAGDGASVSVDVEQSERYAVGVRGITVRPHQPIEDVRGAADRIVDGAQELGEPLAVVEADKDRAIVRSAEPEADEGGVTYWEADVRSDETSLHRYRKEHDAIEREVVTEPLPHRTVGKIAEQLADSMNTNGR